MRDLLVLILVIPGVFIAAKITQDFTCALPIFSSKFIGLKKLVPSILIGSKLLLLLIFTPKSLRGLITLEKSLFERLLSPINFTVNFDFTSSPMISLAKVPELPALIVVFLFMLYPFIP